MRIIAHLDMDAFFASVEELDNPRFRGLPLAVGADPDGGKGRGVVSTANYAARAYGIRSALPISKAWQYSEEARKQGKPPVIFLPPNFRRYAEISGRIMRIIRKYASLVEEASIDEAYFDLSHLASFERARKTAKHIKAEIKKHEHLTASIGVGPNKLIAKIASDRQKPDGLTVVLPEEAEAFLEPLPIRVIPGIGPKTGVQLLVKGVHTIQDAKRFGKDALREIFGKWGVELYDKLRGVSDSPVIEFYETKSIGEQETFAVDTLDSAVIITALEGMCARITAQLQKDGFTGFRAAVLIIRFANFDTKTRSHTLRAPASSFEVLRFETLKLLMPFFDRRENPHRMRLRLIGVRIEKLQKNDVVSQPTLIH
ncbi:MAG: DNA polymerase IV [bacterium]|nr:DNA polymerase IV [bacterium]